MRLRREPQIPPDATTDVEGVTAEYEQNVVQPTAPVEVMEPSKTGAAFAMLQPPNMTEPSIISIPNSLREQLQRVQLLLNQSEHAKANGRDEVAQTKAQQAVNVMNTLINRSTESGMLAVLADMGVQGYTYGTTEEIEAYVVLERRAFGMSFGQEVVPTKKIVRRNSQGRVF